MGLFDWMSEASDRARHRAILSDALKDNPSTPESPPPSSGVDGFLPPQEAAVAMALQVDELMQLVGQGALEARPMGGTLWIRPAILSRASITHLNAGGDRVA